MKTSDLLILIEDLKKEVSLLKKENKQLKKLLSKGEVPKTSRNSSVAPSKDENRPKPNQSLRKSSGKKSGGQMGRKGKTLEMTSTPDKIIELHPDYCNSCGASLKELSAIKEQVRQIIDIPPIKAVYTEYQSFSITCNCGCQTTASFPKQVTSPISYGATIESLIGYFHARQYLPFARMQEVFNDVFNINISEGGIHYLLSRFADKTTDIYDLIKQRVATSKVVGTDETGVKVNGGKHWFWTWQTKNLTYIAHATNRKFDTVNQHFKDGFPNSTLVHDGWKPQMKTVAENHQNCIPHLLRRLNYLNQRYPKASWGVNFQKLLYKAIALKKKMSTKDYENNFERVRIIRELEKLLNHHPNSQDNELYSFYKRMRKERETLFIFLFLENVPADNNASERAIRNVKVKQKISGQFKKIETAQNFAKIRSIIDTTIKNGMNVIDSLNLIAKFEFKIVN
jgi:transposase